MVVAAKCPTGLAQPCKLNHKSRNDVCTTYNNNELLKLFDKGTHHAARDHILIMGDFNYPELDYNSWTSLLNSEKDSSRFFDKTHDLFLYQHVSDLTRVRAGQHLSKLDYVFTDEENAVDKVNCTAPLGKSDHVCIEFNYLTGVCQTRT